MKAADALTCYQRAMALLRSQRLEEALAGFTQASALEPDSARFHAARAGVLCDLRRLDAALAGFDRAIELEPRWVWLHLSRGATAFIAGRMELALASYDEVLALEPGSAAGHKGRGAVLLNLNRPDEALLSLDKAVEQEPRSAEAHQGRGSALRALGRNTEALASWDAAVKLNSGWALPYTNRGPALQDLERPEEALESCDRALALGFDSVETHINRGGALHDLGRLEESLASYERAMALEPRSASAHCNAGLMYLQLGRLETGWRLYERRPEASSKSAAPTQRAWRACEGFAGKTLFIEWEQGFGDTIQFCRYVKLAEERGARVLFAVQDPLRRVLAGLSTTVQFLGETATPREFDFHYPLLSLPLAFGTRMANIPCLERYLSAEPARAARWGERLGTHGLKVGICWQGNPRNRAETGRSPPLRLFAPLAAIPGVRLISLQKGPGVEQLADLPPGMTVEVLGEEFDGGPDAFVDTAAVMDNLDLVITCDTSVAHLAGALGRPTWLALKHIPEWRWFLDREDSPWYPAHRLFRQTRRGDWDSVFAAMRAALLERIR